MGELSIVGESKIVKQVGVISCFFMCMLALLDSTVIDSCKNIQNIL